MKAHASIPRDRSKIVIDSENQVRIWTRHFGATQQELARAIETVGNSAAACVSNLPHPDQPLSRSRQFPQQSRRAFASIKQVQAQRL